MNCSLQLARWRAAVGSSFLYVLELQNISRYISKIVDLRFEL